MPANPVAVPVHPLIAERYSPLAYAPRAVSIEVIRQVLEAARWAPSSYNRQPWHFLVTRQGEPGYQRLLATMVPWNRGWAQAAPVLILASAQTEDERGPNAYAFHDLGMASAQLTLQAVALGLRTRFIAGFDRKAARRAFAIPEAYEPWTIIALGYPGSLDDLPPRYRGAASKPRTRKAPEALIAWGAWGRTRPQHDGG
ncbi:MAG: nitroreductase [Chloroflexi bacterium]|nr:nitroreductase [Chloroflexota bacterium]